MKKIIIRMITTILAITMLFVATVPVYAAAVPSSEVATVENEINSVKEEISQKVEEVIGYLQGMRFEAFIQKVIEKIKVKTAKTSEPEQILPNPETEPECPDLVEGEEKDSETPEVIEPEEVWLYPEDVIDAFEKKLGYRPDYEEVEWLSRDFYSLLIKFEHLGVEYEWRAEFLGYEGWRINQSHFEETFREVCACYCVDTTNEVFYTPEDVEALFKETWKYDCKVYVNKYHTRHGMTADFIVCDYYNGCEIEIDAVGTKEGWSITQENWEWFCENFDLEEESDYANSNIGWWTLDEIIEEFEYLLGYVPSFEIKQDSELEWRYIIRIDFEHLGGRSYWIEWGVISGQEVTVSDKIFQELLEENPEVTMLLDIYDEEELERMYAFYKARLED